MSWILGLSSLCFSWEFSPHLYISTYICHLLLLFLNLIYVLSHVGACGCALFFIYIYSFQYVYMHVYVWCCVLYMYRIQFLLQAACCLGVCSCLLSRTALLWCSHKCFLVHTCKNLPFVCAWESKWWATGACVVSAAGYTKLFRTRVLVELLSSARE